MGGLLATSCANVGLPAFADDIAAAGGAVVQSRAGRRPPARMPTSVWRLAMLDRRSRAIEQANRTAYARYLAARPRLVDLLLGARCHCRAGRRRAAHAACRPADRLGTDVRPDAGGHRRRRCSTKAGPIRPSAADAEWPRAARWPSNPATTTGRSARWPGVIRPSMPVWVVENDGPWQPSYCNLNEGLGKVLRFGANGPEVIARLRWMQAPTVHATGRAVRSTPWRTTRAQAAAGAGPAHGRRGAQPQRRRHPVCCLKRLASGAARHGISTDRRDCGGPWFIAGNDHFFLNVSMAAAKAMLDAGGRASAAARRW
jgi:hypothetical protein